MLLEAMYGSQRLMQTCRRVQRNAVGVWTITTPEAPIH